MTYISHDERSLSIKVRYLCYTSVFFIMIFQLVIKDRKNANVCIKIIFLK